MTRCAHGDLSGSVLVEYVGVATIVARPSDARGVAQVTEGEQWSGCMRHEAVAGTLAVGGGGNGLRGEGAVCECSIGDGVRVDQVARHLL